MAWLVAIALVTSACSHQHAGKTVAGGILVMTAGTALFRATAEEEGDAVPTVSMVMVPIGLLLVTGGIWAGSRCPRQR